MNGAQSGRECAVGDTEKVQSKTDPLWYIHALHTPITDGLVCRSPSICNAGARLLRRTYNNRHKLTTKVVIHNMTVILILL